MPEGGGAPIAAAPHWTAEQQRRIALIAASYQRLLGQPLLATPDGRPPTAAALWQAPCVIVAHGTQADPIFFYGNRLALTLFDCDFAAFTAMPSRLSAEPLLRAERQRLLQRVSTAGYIDDYAGVRISATGRRFRIERAVVWNLIDAEQVCHGQAATFSVWTPLD